MPAVSPNCADQYNTIKTIIHATAQDMEEPSCKAEDYVMSCQNSNFETADAPTKQKLQHILEAQLVKQGCPKDNYLMNITANQVGANGMGDRSPAEMTYTGKVSNCFYADNANEIAFMIEGRCKNLYDFEDKATGTMVRSDDTIVAKLQVCDVSDLAMAQSMEDVRKVAAYTYNNNKDNAQKIVNVEDLSCHFSVLPAV